MALRVYWILFKYWNLLNLLVREHSATTICCLNMIAYQRLLFGSTWWSMSNLSKWRSIWSLWFYTITRMFSKSTLSRNRPSASSLTMNRMIGLNSSTMVSDNQIAEISWIYFKSLMIISIDYQNYRIISNESFIHN